MNTLTKFEIQKLSFPDCKVVDMMFDIPNRIVEIKTNSGYLSINGGVKLKFCKLVVKDWQSMNALLYQTKTKQWEKLSIDNIERLVDICEFDCNEEIVFRGFGAITGQWVEIVFSKAKLDVKCEKLSE